MELIFLFHRRIYFGRTQFTVKLQETAAKTFEKIFKSVLNNEVGLQFLINPLFLPFSFKEFYYSFPLWCRKLFVSFSVIVWF